MNPRRIGLLAALILAVAVGLVHYTAHDRVRDAFEKDAALKSEFEYSPLSIMPVGAMGDEIRYAAPVRVVFDGAWRVLDPYIYEAAQAARPNPVQPLPALIGGLIAKALGSVPAFFTFSDFLFPCLSVFLGALFFRALGGGPWLSPWASYFLFAMPGFFASLKVFLWRFGSIGIPYDEALGPIIEKFPSYQIVLPYTLVAYVLLTFMIRGRSRALAVLTGVFVGLAAYFYIYSFITLGAQIALLVCFFLALKDRERAGLFFLAGACGLVVAVPYVRETLLFLKEPGYLTKALATVVSTNAHFSLPRELASGTALLAVAAALKKFRHIERTELLFFSSQLVSALAILTLSTVIPVLPQADHLIAFETRGAKIILAFLLLKALFAFLATPPQPGRRKAAYGALAAVLAWNIFSLNAFHLSFYAERANRFHDRYAMHKDSAAAQRWIETSTPPDAVVLSLDAEQIELIPPLTGRHVYLPDLFFSTISLDEVWRRYLDTCLLLGVPLEAARRHIDYHQDPAVEAALATREKDFKTTYEYLRSASFHDKVFHGAFSFDPGSVSFATYRDILSKEETAGVLDLSRPVFIPEKILDEKFRDYAPASEPSFKPAFKADFLWFGPVEKRLTGKATLESPALELAYRNDSIDLYRILP